jgi:hypothetical protein
MVMTDIPHMENPVSERNSSSFDDSIGQIGQARIESLKEAVVEIEELIDSREKLSGQIFSDGESMKREITNFLAENAVQNPDDPVEAQERSALRRKKIEVCELQLKEKVDCWKDVALLKKEMRENDRELSEREGRIDMLNGILEGGK